MKEQIFSSTKSFKYILLGIIIATLYFQITEKWTKDNHKTIIFSDALGYYAYLPAAFIYHDMNFGFQKEYENKYYDESKRTNFWNDIDGKRTDKYFCGVAVLLLPFFLLACIFSKIFGFPIDGYSYFFQISVGVAALFYLIIGLVFLRKLLLYYCKENTALFLMLAFFFGSNLLFYTWVEPGMSHVYSFMAMAASLYHLKLSISTHDKKNILWTALFYGLVILIRPSNAVIILALPFLAGTWEILKHFFVKLIQTPGIYVPALFISSAVVFIQMLVFYLESGHWIVYSYTGEKFDFSHPQIVNVLFSYRKGLFIYTPLAFLSLGGIIVLIRRNKFEYISILFLLAVTTWVISSWWSWWYGGSFGQRSFIEYFSIFIILLALFYDSTSGIRRSLLTILILAGVYLNLFQTWQYYKCILPADGMTREKYSDLFFQTNTRFVGVYGGDLYIPKEIKSDITSVTKYDLETHPSELFDLNTLTGEKALSGKYSSKIGGDVNKSVSFSKKRGDILPKLNPDSEYYIQIKFSAWLEDLTSDAKIVMYVDHAGVTSDWQGHFVAHQVAEEKKWTSCVDNIKISSKVEAGDQFWFYILKEDKHVLYMDDLEVDLIQRKK